jgi:hypothetical protein
VNMAPCVSTGDGGKNVAGKYLVAQPIDYFHFSEAPDAVLTSQNISTKLQCGPIKAG